mmetsp:Transcript_29195/g.49113  ORF Transcript_29195/g.49113 Transcript_29195/m.49113 type:complete len:156 (+) Transcript_29195:3135-3602(+)
MIGRLGICERSVGNRASPNAAQITGRRMGRVRTRGPLRCGRQEAEQGAVEEVRLRGAATCEFSDGGQGRLEVRGRGGSAAVAGVATVSDVVAAAAAAAAVVVPGREDRRPPAAFADCCTCTAWFLLGSIARIVLKACVRTFAFPSDCRASISSTR